MTKSCTGFLLNQLMKLRPWRGHKKAKSWVIKTTYQPSLGIHAAGWQGRISPGTPNTWEWDRVTET